MSDMDDLILHLLEIKNVTGIDAETGLESAKKHYRGLLLGERWQALLTLFGSDGVRAGAILLDEAFRADNG